MLRGVSLSVGAGEWVAIMGPSGCGKSTVVHIVGGLDLPDDGTVAVDGTELTQLSVAERAGLRRQKIGFVFQQYNLVPHLDVVSNVELPMRLAGRRHRAAGRRARDLLVSLGLGDRAGEMPNSLSGGEQQRVAIARALANEPPLLLADEPTGALDSEATSTVLDILRQRHIAGQTIVMVTHDAEVAAAADRIVRMRDGEIVEPGRASTDGVP